KAALAVVSDRCVVLEGREDLARFGSGIDLFFVALIVGVLGMKLPHRHSIGIQPLRQGKVSVGPELGDETVPVRCPARRVKSPDARALRVVEASGSSQLLIEV